MYLSLMERSKEKESRSLKKMEKSIPWNALGLMERNWEKAYF